MLNAANGNPLIGKRDEFLVGRAPDAVSDRTCNGQGDASEDDGDNWRQSPQRGIHDLAGAVTARTIRLSGCRSTDR